VDKPTAKHTSAVAVITSVARRVMVLFLRLFSKLLGARATRAARVPKAGADGTSDRKPRSIFKIEIVPADGSRAAK